MDKGDIKLDLIPHIVVIHTTATGVEHYRYSKDLIQVVLKQMGCKIAHSAAIVKWVFDTVSKYATCENGKHGTDCMSYITEQISLSHKF